MRFSKNEEVRKAISIGVLCAVAYLAVYIARNTLGAVAPKTGFSEAFLGQLSSVYFFSYAVGQLINGVIGDRVKARNIIALGLLLAGVANVGFMLLTPVSEMGAIAAYAASAFCLAMVYAPMSKVISENTQPHLAVRCSIGYTFSSLLGSPAAGLIAAFAPIWQISFCASGASLALMAAVCFLFFLRFERMGYVKYGQYEKKATEAKRGTVGVLLRHGIVRFTFVSILTGIVRTSVVFWMPTYFADHLGYTEDHAALLFTAVTLIISCSAFLAIFVYERLGRRMLFTLGLMFGVSAFFFLCTFLFGIPLLNAIFITLAVFFACAAANILWSVYCPSLRDTGRVSSATGFLDFVSYMSAAVSTSLFATAATTIGWGSLVLVWFALALAGVFVSLPYGKWLPKKQTA